MSARFLPLVPAVALVVLLGAPRGAASQTPAQAALAGAHAAQRRFEVERVRFSPENPDRAGTACDEIIGRICHDDGEGGDWYPGPEDPRVVAARQALIDELERSAGVAPDDPWILGQRIVYLGEAGQWESADSLATWACRRSDALGFEDAQGDGELTPGAWCRALDGLALHGLGRFEEAERMFRAAIARMDSTRAREWQAPVVWLDPAGLSWWRGLPVGERPGRASFLWWLADPLLLVPGNDALTEYWARRTMAEASASAANGYGLSWGSDLEEMMMRYGHEIGWEHAAPRPLESGPLVGIGHHHPESRPLLPGVRVLQDPVAAREEDWAPTVRNPRSGYAPPYAAVVLPGAGQLAIFPRGERFVLVGTYALPDDTTYHARHAHELRDRALPPWQDLPSEAGLFLAPADGPSEGQAMLVARSTGRETGQLQLEAPAGRWIASLEVFEPDQRRAGRTRVGVAYAASPADVPTLSDLLLVDSALPEGATLEDAASHSRPRDWLAAGEHLAIAWELFGLGSRTGSISYRLSVEKAGEGVLQRLGRTLGLAGGPPHRSLEWQEPSQEGPGPVLRSVEIELSKADPGVYLIRLEVGLRGRTTLVRERTVEIRPPPR